MEKLKKFVDSSIFQNTILIVIVINAIILGLQTSTNINNSIGGVLEVLDTICLGIFIVEMLLKMVAYKFFGYFKSAWNWFDFVIILTSILSGLAVLSSIRIIRVFRVFRSLKGLRGFKMISRHTDRNVDRTEAHCEIPPKLFNAVKYDRRSEGICQVFFEK